MTPLTPWISIPSDSDFSIYNLPFGIFSREYEPPRMAIAIGDQLIDLFPLANQGHFDDLVPTRTVFSEPSLNSFIACGKKVTNGVRLLVQKWLCEEGSPLHQNQELIYPQASVKMHLPVKVGDYTDFYSSIEHATNVGKMFRDPANALLPNWKHIPVGYHGRASSIIPSGQPVRRPKGQVVANNSTDPSYQPSGRLDFELEMAFIVGKNTELGDSVSASEAEDYIFGMVLFNDWSARDIQKWEYVPLGPFLGKSFASSVSPWVVTMEALSPFKVPGPEQNPPVLPYLNYVGNKNYDIQLEVSIQPKNAAETVVSRSNFKYMYWNMAQQLAHHTINGCNVNVGDMMASGTISGKDENSYGSMLELAWMGTKPLKMSDGTERVFINDYDTVIMRGHAEKDGVRVGFGEVRAEVLPGK